MPSLVSWLYVEGSARGGGGLGDEGDERVGTTQRIYQSSGAPGVCFYALPVKLIIREKASKRERGAGGGRVGEEKRRLCVGLVVDKVTSLATPTPLTAQRINQSNGAPSVCFYALPGKLVICEKASKKGGGVRGRRGKRRAVCGGEDGYGGLLAGTELLTLTLFFCALAADDRGAAVLALSDPAH